jgi:hypothetical protein
MEDMTGCARELEEAANAIDAASLEAAKAAVAASCQEYLRWADIFSRRLDDAPDEKLHKFARAFALTLLGHLPTRPATCPFCIQYGQDRSCTGCGYGATHGRCDEEDSAFSLFIEAFQELGLAVYQDTDGLSIDPGHAKELLQQSLKISINTAQKMQEELYCVSSLQLMELKAFYLKDMICLLPIRIFSNEVEVKSKVVVDYLENYW